MSDARLKAGATKSCGNLECHTGSSACLVLILQMEKAEKLPFPAFRVKSLSYFALVHAPRMAPIRHNPTSG
jgi:hypothetical protein